LSRRIVEVSDQSVDPDSDPSQAGLLRQVERLGIRRDRRQSVSLDMSRRNRCDPSVLLREVEYARPSSVAEAIQLLDAHEGARALAGGQTLVNVMKARAASPDVLVDLNRLDELRAITVSGETLQLGAMATYTQIMGSSEVDVSRPILAEVAAQIADVQVRNRGTIGGNVCSNDPTNHLPPLLVALGASMTIAGTGGERTVPANEFFLGVYMTAVGEGELLLSISVPAAANAADGFSSVTIGRDGTCLANAAASLAGDSVQIALGCVDAVPVLLTPTSSDEDSVRQALEDAALDPPSDVHASADYRRHLAGVCAVRAVAQAQERGR
jgi:carbon-monoxide dehydrogenase medium subunit